MARLALLLFLPVSIGAMVLLSSEEDKEMTDAARIITATGDRSDRLYRIQDWDHKPMDLPDLSVLDGLPDLELVHSGSRITDSAVANNVGRQDLFVTDVLGDSDRERSVRFEDIGDSSLANGIIEAPKLEDTDASVMIPSEQIIDMLYRQVAKIYNSELSKGKTPDGQGDSWTGDNGKENFEDDNDADIDDDDDEDDEEEEDTDDAFVYDGSDADNDIANNVTTENVFDDGTETPFEEGRPSEMLESLFRETETQPDAGYSKWDQLNVLPPGSDQAGLRVRRSTQRRQEDPPRERTKQRGQKRARELKRRARMGRKRSRVDAQVEVLVFVENSIYRSFLASNDNNPQVALARIRRYYGIVFAMIDQRFQTIDHAKLSISVKISGILIAETREDSSWLEQLVDWSTSREHGRASVNTDKALHEFSMWIKHNHKQLPKFDHAMVFCGYRLTNTRGFTFGGKAYLNAICDVENGNSVSLVADNGDFQCVKVAAHELAHSMGSLHDGDPGVEHCPPDGNYVMAAATSPGPEKLKNAFYFSQCSIQQMRKLLRTKKTRCVRDEPTVFYNYDMKRLPPGQVISLDQHCRLIYGKQSTFCGEPDVMGQMCGQLWCRDPELNNGCRTNSYLTALPGTTCDKGKTCHLGECLTEDQIQRMDEAREQRTSTHSDSEPGDDSFSSSQYLAPSSSGREVVAGSTQAKLAGGATHLDNTIPTLPHTVIRGRVGQPDKLRSSTRGRQRTRPGRRRNRDRTRKRGRCKVNQPDVNVEYCRGLVTLNPGACKRRAIRNYCCRTCAFGR